MVPRLPRSHSAATTPTAANVHLTLTHAVRATSRVPESQEDPDRAAREETFARLGRLSTAVAAWTAGRGRCPEADDIYELVDGPGGRADLAPVDGWGPPFVYATSDHGRHCRLISGGADGVVDARSRRVPQLPGPFEADDIVFQDGEHLVPSD